MRHFAQHLIDRYGIDEVSQWYFEVWNEPNIDFWNGIPRQQSYFDLYAHTARDLKAVSPRLRVGGPATAAAAWVGDFLKFTAANHVPVDFVSTHAYADGTVENLFGSSEEIAMDERVCRAAAKVRGEIKSSATPDLPLFITEWNIQGMMGTRDTIFAGLALANTVHTAPDARVTIQRIDDQHGNVLPEYAAMGAPLDPTPAQVEQMNRATTLPAPAEERLTGGKLAIKLTPNLLS